MKRQLCLLGFLLVALAACTTPAVDPPTTTIGPTSGPTLAPSLAPTETLTPRETPIPVSKLCSPLRDHAFVDLNKYITQPFIPPQGANKELGHHGIDFGYYHRDGVGGPLEGNPIQSVLDGSMAGLGYNKVYGNYLIIETTYERLPAELAASFPIKSGESLYVLYAHMQDLAPFEFFEPLDCGQQIGQVGKSGDPQFVAEPHLHFEMRVGKSGIFVDPMAFYDTQASQEEKDEYVRWRSSDTFNLVDPMIFIKYAASVEEING